MWCLHLVSNHTTLFLWCRNSEGRYSKGCVFAYPGMLDHLGFDHVLRGTVLVFRHEFALENSVGSHACSLEALPFV
jgi:hypothetical protein